MSNLSFDTAISINECAKLISAIGATNTIVIQSEPGCGKTSILKMLQEEHGDKYHYVYVDCPVTDTADVGMRIPNHATGKLEYYLSSLFPMDGKPLMIMLDEFMKSPKMMQVMWTRLMLERMVGDHPLPDGSTVFATSNNESDGLGDTMLAHAANRVVRVKMRKANVPEWTTWAGENGIHPLIRAWVTMNPRALASYSDGGQEENPFILRPGKAGPLSFVSLRSLAKSDPIIRNKDVLGPVVTKAALAGTIGAAAAESMAAFLSMEKELFSVRTVIKDPEGTPVPEKLAALFMMMFNAVDVIETQDELSDFMRYVNRIPSSEVQAVFFTMLLQTKRTVRIAKNNEQIKAWAAKNFDLMG